MRSRKEFERGHALSRLVAVGLLGSLAAACSSETMRFADNPFSNPFKGGSSTEPAMTGSVTPPVATAARTMPVQSQPLPAIGAPQPAPVAAQPLPAVRAAPAPAPMASGGPVGWTAQGGTPVTVGAGDSLNAIATRYGVPASAILSANGISSAAQVTPGRQLVIPVYNAVGGQAAAPAAAPTGQTKYRLVEEAKPAPVKTATPKLAEAPKDRVRPGMAGKDAKVATEQAKQKAASLQTRETPVKAEPLKPVQAAKAPEPVKVAKIEAPVAEAPKAAPAPVAVQPKEVAKPAPAKEPEVTASLPAQASAPEADFRWPARGRVIAGFGANGGNEGINIAVPEGTPVKATENGTVTYAGSEVRGYGNLVLIKHDNGYVSAYAHNGELAVKRGEKVRRGQVIAKSGQTGNVTSPQLHFELRNGSKPVDPMPLLSN